VVLFTQEVSSVYASPFLDADELKMAFRARKVSGTFEKQAPELFNAFQVLLQGRSENYFM